MSIEDLRKDLIELQKVVDALPKWKKVVYERARQAEIKLGFIKDPNIKKKGP